MTPKSKALKKKVEIPKNWRDSHPLYKGWRNAPKETAHDVSVDTNPREHYNK